MAEMKAPTAAKAAGAVGQPVASREMAHAVAASILRESAPPMDRDAPADVPYWAKRTFDYAGASLDRGQVFRLRRTVNDRRLVDLGYVAPIAKGATTYECSACGAAFVEMALRDGHAKARHAPRRFVPPPAPIREPGEPQDGYQNRLDEWALMAGKMAEAAEDKRDRIENELAPLDLTKTAASRGA